MRGYTNAKFDRFAELKDAVAFVGCCEGVKCCEGHCPEDCTLKTDTQEKNDTRKRTSSRKEDEDFGEFFASHRTHTVQLLLRSSF